MTSMTSPPQADGGRALGGGFPQPGRQFADQGQQQGTMPMTAGFGRAADQPPAVQSGVATQYWHEAIPIPPGPARLHLFVNNRWVSLVSPSTVVLDLVQRAFLGADSRVQVWFDDQNGSIAGLVVEGS